MKITEFLVNLEEKQAAHFPLSNTSAIRQTIYRLQNKGIGRWETEKAGNTLQVRRVIFEVPQEIIDIIFNKAENMDLSPIEESKSLSDSFTIDGIEYLVDGEVSAKFDQHCDDESTNSWTITELSRDIQFSVSGYYNEIEISRYETK